MAESRNVLHAGAPLERTLSPQRGLPWRTTVFPRHGCAAPRRNCAKVSLSCTKAQPGPGRPAWEVLTGRLGRDSWNSGCTKRESRGPGGVITRSPQVEWGGGRAGSPKGPRQLGRISPKASGVPPVPGRYGWGRGKGMDKDSQGPPPGLTVQTGYRGSCQADGWTPTCPGLTFTQDSREGLPEGGLRKGGKEKGR